MTVTLPRDRHLFGPGPKRILALDGGGVRGAISIGYLERLEKQIEDIAGKPIPLCDWFDLIGGTSTGAIIACALALGYRASDIRDRYKVLGPRVFRRPFYRLSGIQAKFDARSLIHELFEIYGDRTLDSEDLRTGFAVVTKRLDSGSSWIVANNPRAQFWETPADASFIGNRHYRLVDLVRASSAAPYFFDPQPISIAAEMPPGVFVDGALTPHNNPSLYMFLLATLPQFGLRWPIGPDNLTIVSVGTGSSYLHKMTMRDARWTRALGIAVHSLASLMSDSQQFVLALMSWLGESPMAWKINSELGDLSAVPPPHGQPFFRFLRYDVALEADWLRDHLGLPLDTKTVMSYRRLDAPENIPALYELGARAAEQQIERSHLERA
jgi:hypothetical protein